jgi:rhamnosyltransferase
LIEFNKVCGIIVTYNPDDSNLEVIRNDCLTLYSTIIFDNSTENNYQDRLDRTIREIQASDNGTRKITLIRQGHNIGLSRSYNQSIRLAEMMGFKFVLILDQDSLITRDAIMALIRDLDMLLKEGINVGAIAAHNTQNYFTPLSFLFNGKFRWNGFYYSDNIQEKRNLINSGMLIPVHNFNLVNGYDESFFVDNSDLEFTLRIRINNLRLFESNGAKVMVNYKEETYNYIVASISFRKPEREYSIRDLIRCLPLAYKISKIDMFLVFLLIVSKLLGTLLFKDNKRARFAFILSGIKDGMHCLIMKRFRTHPQY